MSWLRMGPKLAMIRSFFFFSQRSRSVGAEQCISAGSVYKDFLQ